MQLETGSGAGGPFGLVEVTVIADLEKLAQLRRNGVLNENEFADMKAKLLQAPAAPTWATKPLLSMDSDEQIIRRLAEYKKLSGIAWIIIGGLQICLVVTAIAGVWNVVVGLSRLATSKAITARDPRVPDSAQGTTQLIVLGVVNLCLGAVFGLIMVGVDFYIRDQILTNARLFNGQSPESFGVAVPSQLAGPTGVTPFISGSFATGRGVVTEMIHGSRVKAVLYLLLSAGFVACSPLLIQSVDLKEQIGGWLGLTFFGAGALVFAWLIIRPQRLTLNKKGFTLSGGLVWSPKTELWQNTTAFFLYSLPRSGTSIGYNYVAGVKKDTALLRVNRTLGAEASLPRVWKGSPKLMAGRLNDYRAQALRAAC
jgi:hypothetical protein